MPNPSIPRWLQLHAPTVVGAALILAMSISLAWQTADWIRLLRAPVQVSSNAPQTALTPPALERLAPLFGPSPTSDTSATPPATNLRLTLLGSFVNADPKRSSAIIQRDGSKPQRYNVGIEVDQGVRLHAVYRDRVELERNGRLETLPFPTRTLSGSNPSAVVPAPAPAPAPAEDSADQLSELQDEDLQQLRERMNALRQQMEAAGTLPPDQESAPTEQPTESE
ncbi:general secretion pathway protein GspN [Pseudomonas cavernae]|uniref:General secretion pathway protein GspN n=1 Tax=Pseudomonas cavernae TaxID=2320867 RepID=A0A385Z7B0_9PSED|nr:general secretion pathway protein GspN [Pseudomonas cavernae]